MILWTFDSPESTDLIKGTFESSETPDLILWTFEGSKNYVLVWRLFESSRSSGSVQRTNESSKTLFWFDNHFKRSVLIILWSFVSSENSVLVWWSFESSENSVLMIILKARFWFHDHLEAQKIQCWFADHSIAHGSWDLIWQTFESLKTSLHKIHKTNIHFWFYKHFKFQKT